MKRFIFLLALIIILMTGCFAVKKSNNKIIVASSFPCYDFARAITKNTDIEVKLLLSSGVDMHSFEPTPKDVIDIEDALLFIYVGGESDEWVTGVLNTTGKNVNKTFRLIDSVELVNEANQSILEGNNENEIDEHVWTSPINAIKIINDMKNKLIELVPEYEKKFSENAEGYILEIQKIDEEIRNIVANSSKKELIFADRFPIIYFALEYGLDYYAAFPGCAHEVEPNAKTISQLINKVKKDKIPVIFKVELSDGNIANTIHKETGAKIRTFETAHNISKKDFDSGITYVDLMKRNIEVLKEALKWV